MSRRKTNSFGDRLLMVLVGLFLYAPIIILIVFSFNAGNSSSVWKGFSLHWYQQLFHNRLIMHSVYTTLMVSLLATIIATIAGLVMLFVPTYSYAQSLFWLAWPIGGLLCGIVSLLMKAFDSEK